MIFSEKINFYSTKSENYTIVFGKKNFNINDFLKANNIKHHSYCEQTHSNIMFKADIDKTYKCDALHTTDKNHALIIKTADCVPILIHDNNTIIAIHAGWRGLCSNIINNIKTLNLATPVHAFIGPHIQQNSYEVGSDVINLILKNNPMLKNNINEFINPKKNNKVLLNLNKLSQILLISAGISEKNILNLDIDTFTSNQWNSYRRDQSLAGRNLSLIIKN